jgi:hypothetical protein
VTLLASVGAGVVLAGCAGAEQQGAPRSRVSAWVGDSSIGETIGTLTGDNGAVSKALGQRADANTLHTVCAVLEADASSADSTLPSPDRQITDELNAAYRAELATANDCFTGARGDGRLLTQAALERNRATALLAAAIARIVQITGTSPPTTTTTSAGGDIPGL